MGLNPSLQRWSQWETLTPCRSQLSARCRMEWGAFEPEVGPPGADMGDDRESWLSFVREVGLPVEVVIQLRGGR